MLSRMLSALGRRVVVDYINSRYYRVIHVSQFYVLSALKISKVLIEAWKVTLVYSTSCVPHEPGSRQLR
jgi:hypothetical protein